MNGARARFLAIIEALTQSQTPTNTHPSPPRRAGARLDSHHFAGGIIGQRGVHIGRERILLPQQHEEVLVPRVLPRGAVDLLKARALTDGVTVKGKAKWLKRRRN